MSDFICFQCKSKIQTKLWGRTKIEVKCECPHEEDYVRTSNVDDVIQKFLIQFDLYDPNNPPEKQKKKPAMHGKPWTHELEEKLTRQWLEYSKNNTKKSEIIIQLAKDLRRSKKAISKRLQRLGLLETGKKLITKREQTLDEIRTSAKKNNERLYFCLNGHVRRSGDNPWRLTCNCGLESVYNQSGLKEFENYPIKKKENKNKERGEWYDNKNQKVEIENKSTTDKIIIEKIKITATISNGLENNEEIQNENITNRKIHREKESIPEKITEFIIKLDNSSIDKHSNVTLQWEKPKENGSKIKNYKIQFKNNKEKSWEELNSKISEIKIKLTRGSKYQFRVASENKHGSSEYSIIKEK